MKFEDIIEAWDADSNIDRLNLGSEALRIPKLHSKYYKIYVNEAIHLRKLESGYKELRLDKYEFLTLGHTDESQKKGWKLPPQGRIIKSEVEMYLEADKDLAALALKIATQKEKTKFLESIIREIGSRNFHIRAAIDYEKFRAGV